MDRAGKIGLGVASAGHVLLFAALSASWLAADPLKLDSAPIEISIADDVAIQSAAPKIADAPPPPSGAEEHADQPEPTPPAPSAHDRVAEPVPAPSPTPAPKPKPAASQPAKAKAGGLRLDTSDWMKPASGANPQARATNAAPASAIGPAQQSALAAEIRRQIKPYWKAPTGADADQLRTTLAVKLARDGALIGDPQIISTSGQTLSNRGQVRLHQEQALKAVRLAAPFHLPPDLYESWKSLSITVDRKLSQ